MKDMTIALIGAGWMAKAHAAGFYNVPIVFGSGFGTPRIVGVADTNIEAAKRLAALFNIPKVTTDWRELVALPEVQVVDITTPNDVHPEIAIAAAKAGKHIYCEKPMANSSAEVDAMLKAARDAGVITLVGFNYLKNPIQGFAKQLIMEGQLGEILSFRGTFDADYMTDPNYPFTWRNERRLAGSGALGDMASHTISMAQMLVGQITEVCGTTKIFCAERLTGDGTSRVVENDDFAHFLCSFANGAAGHISASRMATGRKLYASYEIQGTKGALYFDQERQNELRYYRHTDTPGERGYKDIIISPEHPDYRNFFHLPGNALGYSDQKIIEAFHLLKAVALGEPAYPDFAFGAHVNHVVDAVLRSVETRRWERVE